MPILVVVNVLVSKQLLMTHSKMRKGKFGLLSLPDI